MFVIIKKGDIVKKSLSLTLTWVLIKTNTWTKEEKDKINNDQQRKKIKTMKR